MSPFLRLTLLFRSVALCLVCATLVMVNVHAQPITYPGLRVVGRQLYTPCNDKVVLRGVNKMIVWTSDLALRKQSYVEIRKSGANCVRIVWLVQPGQYEVDAGVDGLDRTIQDCIDNDMIPMIELHDATGQWSKLQMILDYWKRPDVVAVIKKHEKYLIVNIANECGEYEVTDEMFKSGYESALTQLRSAGIHTPLVIDAADWGKNLEQLVRVGSYLIDKDPDKNVMFSVHMYWSKNDGADANYITSQMQSAVNVGLPFMIGEFAGLFNRGGACTYEADYETMIQRAQEMEVGYLPWEWGPGNETAHPTCTVMNMTTNNYYNTLQAGWATAIVLTSPNSIKNTSITPQYIVDGGMCTPSSVDEIASNIADVTIAPNPFSESARITVCTPRDGNLRITIVNVFGEAVAVVCDEYTLRGRRDITLNIPYDVSGGALFCCVESNGSRVLRQIQIIR
ncbi:MAG: cellulase family glycosylhydrolase [bacterium]|nr:cellulase family glycosylhydrolase [bacterium]